MEDFTFPENPALPKIPYSHLENTAKVLEEYLPQDLIYYVVLPLFINFNDELLVCLDRMSKCVDKKESKELSKRMEYILKQNIDPNYDGGSPLRLAFATDLTDYVDQLVKLGADPKLDGSMLYAAAICSPFRVRLLKNALLADILINDETKMLAMEFALRAKNKIAMGYFFNEHSLFIECYFQKIVEMAMTITGDLNFVQFMVYLSCKILGWDKDDLDLLKSAAGTVLGTIAHMVADGNKEELKKCISADESGILLNTVFHIAAAKDELAILFMCFNMGVNIGPVVNRDVVYLTIWHYCFYSTKCIAEKLTQDDKDKLLLATFETGEVKMIKCAIDIDADYRKVFATKNAEIKKFASVYYQVCEDQDYLNSVQYVKKLFNKHCYYVDSRKHGRKFGYAVVLRDMDSY